MLDTRIILSATWVVATLIYLYGDVLRIYYGGEKAKALAGMNLNQFVWLGIAVLMLTPILMVFLTLVLPQPASRWANIIVAAFFFLFLRERNGTEKQRGYKHAKRSREP